MLRFGLFGIPVTIEPWFWLSAAILQMQLLTSGSPDAIPILAAWIFVVLVSVLWHELGHALAFRKYGYSPEITLLAFGGFATARGVANLPKHRDIIISLAGPAFGFLLWGVLTLLLVTGVIPALSTLPQGARHILGFLLFANLWWSILNLIPIYPLDGGRVLFAALGPARRKQALIISMVLGVLLALWALNTSSIFLAVIVGMMTYQNYQRFQAHSAQGWR